PDELFQWHVQSADGGLRFGGLKPARLRRDLPAAVVELNFCRRFRNAFDRPQAVLRVTDVHANVQRFKFHAENLVLIILFVILLNGTGKEREGEEIYSL